MKPGLFAQDHNNSSRDYSDSYFWGKNQFNSSFPASLVAYMSSKDINPVYIKTNKQNVIVHSEITGSNLYGIDPLADNAFYMFESGFRYLNTVYITNLTICAL